MIVTLITFGAMLYPAIKNRSVNNSYAVSSLHLLSNGEDNASHYALYKYTYIHDGYAYGSDSKHTGLVRTLVNYPQGSEFDLGWIARATLGGGYAHKDTVLVELYFILTSGMFSVFIGLITLTGVRLYERSRQFQSAQIGLLLPVATAVLFCGPLLELVGRGFQSQTAAYIYFILILLTIANHKRIANRAVTLALLLLLFAGTCMAWWYLFPVALAPIVWFVFKTKLYDIRRLWVLLLIPLFGIYPVILSLLSSTGASSLNEPGGVDKISFVALAFYALSCFATCFYMYKRKRDELGYIVSTLAVWVAFTVLVAIYQLATIHSLQYYYYKSLYTLVPVAGACIIYLCLIGYDKIIGSDKLRATIVLVLPTVLFILGFAIIKPTYPRVYLNDWYNNPISFNQLVPLYTATEADQHSDLLFIGGCSNTVNYLMDRWSGAFLLSDTPKRDGFVVSTLKGDTPKMLTYLKHATKASTPYIQADDTCLAPSLSAYSQQLK